MNAINDGILPHKSSKVWSLTAPLSVFNYAHGNNARQRSIAVDSRAYGFSIKTDDKGIITVNFFCLINQDMDNVLRNPPVPCFIGISNRCSGNFVTDAYMI